MVGDIRIAKGEIDSLAELPDFVSGMPEKFQFIYKVFKELLEEESVNRLFTDFHAVVGVPVAIIDLNANVLASSPWQRICTTFHRATPGTCARCIQSDTELANNLNAGSQFAIYDCKNGMTDCASPIIIEGEHIANLFIGQFLRKPAERTFFERQAKEFNLPVSDYMSALDEVPVVDDTKVPAIMGFLVHFAHMVAGMGLEKVRSLRIEEQARERLEEQVQERTADLQQAIHNLGTEIEERQKTEARLSDAFQVISSSIQYASRIQRAVLPDPSFLSSIVNDHFVLWEPRDVVGGDFYWTGKWGSGYLILLGDCTGHGVPGAFMTLISIGALDRALSEAKLGDVQALVQRMHQLLRQSLSQDSSNTNTNDGLELGVCYLEPLERRLTYIGARFDLFVICEGEVSQINSSKKGIGYPEVPEDQVFEATVIDTKLGAKFYMTTDGAVDQINSADGRRFGKARFKNLLLSHHEMPMADQGQAILKAVLEYQGDAPRLDDIAVIGFDMN
jgi:serine phosphatase RsbU (regulator of sigma subunit)/ligand-binding sensor protein